MLEVRSMGMAFNKRVHVMCSIKLKEETGEVEKHILNVGHAAM